MAAPAAGPSPLRQAWGGACSHQLAQGRAASSALGGTESPNPHPAAALRRDPADAPSLAAKALAAAPPIQVPAPGVAPSAFAAAAGGALSPMAGGGGAAAFTEDPPIWQDIFRCARAGGRSDLGSRQI